MNERVLMLEPNYEQDKNFQIDINAYFLKFLRTLKKISLDYNETRDYSYLKNILKILNKNIDFLNFQSFEKRKEEVLIILEFYKKNSIPSNLNFLTFREITNTLTKIMIEKNIENLLYEVIFKYKKLEYLDKVIEANSEVLNKKIFQIPIFLKVIFEYIKSLTMKNQGLCLYYERVINKFLNNKDFIITPNMQVNIKISVDKYLKFENEEALRIRIRKILNRINNKKNLFSLFSIGKVENSNTNFKKLDEEVRLKINDYIMTIDEDEALVLDDATSLEVLKNGNIIHKIHIADPFAYVTYNSKLIKNAKLKSSTIYQKDIQIPMFPLSLAGDSWSLVKGKRRYTKTFCFEYDSNFNLVNSYFLNTTIEVSERTSYNALNELYKKGGKDKESELMLYYYARILETLKKMLKNVSYYEANKSSNLVGNLQFLGNFSEDLVAHSMILTGYKVADYFKTNKLPYVYRCQEIDTTFEELIAKMKFQSHSSEYSKMLKKLNGYQAKSFYTVDNIGHVGLQLPCYSHITSPLRRYADLLNIEALNLLYFKKSSDKEIANLESKMRESCTYLNFQRNTIEDYLKVKEKKL